MRPRLFYFSHGRRRYDQHPVRIHSRPYWEFQAVISGRISPIFEDRVEPPRAHALWVFEPGCAHGWTGPVGKSAEIIVFHLPAPDTLLDREIRRTHGSLCVSLLPEDRGWLVAQRDALQADWLKPTEETPLKVDHLLSGLALLLLQRSGFQPAVPASGLDQERVEKALYWYRQNIGQNPGVADVARAVGVSAVHLRRLFLKEINQSPKAALQEIRLGQARDLLDEPRVTVEAAAAQFGFADASSFSRAFRLHFGHSPRRRNRRS